jgi:cytochrome c oxidase assembly protein subunit 15
VFRTFGIISLVSIYLLILAGGIVRSTGSGMGCPDWPKCFGRMIPPTQASELPFNYQEIYKEKLHGQVLFNPTKTWIEYLNRLLGALTGIFVFIATILSVKHGKKVFLHTMAALILVLLNAVLGKYVVDSFLLPGVVTAHMLLSIGVIYFLMKAINIHSNFEVTTIENRKWIMINLCIVFLQILFGTQVRENVDHVISALGESAKEQWISQLGFMFITHRTFSWVIFLGHLYLWNKLKLSALQRYRNAMMALIGISFSTGILMAYFAFPLGSQAIHLFISLMLIGLHINAYIRTKPVHV